MAGLNGYYEFFKDAKFQHPNAIVLMQIGDFYNAFDDDAQACVDELG